MLWEIMGIILTLVLQFYYMHMYSAIISMFPPPLSLSSVCVCVQGQKKVECVGFVSREGQAKTFVCHIFKAASQAMVSHMYMCWDRVHVCARVCVRVE